MNPSPNHKNVQTQSLTNRLLGYPPEARLLIINADDLGMCQAVNAAIFGTLLGGVARSTSLMVPCPWAMQAMQFLRFGVRTDIPDLMTGLAKEYGLALRVRGRDWTDKVHSQALPANDYDFLDSSGFSPAEKARVFLELLHTLPSGLNEWAVHPGFDGAELRAIEPEGSLVRQADYDFLMSQEAKDVVESEGILLIDYRALQTVWKG